VSSVARVQVTLHRSRGSNKRTDCSASYGGRRS